MKISLRLFLNSHQRQHLAVSEYWESLGKGQPVIDLEWPSERTERVIEIASEKEIELWHAYINFDKKELNNYDYFELIPTQVVNISRADSNMFDNVLSEDPLIIRQRNHKIPSKIIASSIKLNENSIACYGGFSDELITSSFVMDILGKSGLNGWYMQDISKRDGSVHTIYKRLNAKNLVEVTAFDISTAKMISGLEKKTIDSLVEIASLDGDNPLEESELRNAIRSKYGERKETEVFRYLGGKTLEPNQVAELADFSRLGDNELGVLTGWIVSRRAKDTFIKNKIRGIRFKPVLVAGTEPHSKYLDLWHDAVVFLAAHNVAYQQVPLKIYLKNSENCK